MSNPETPASEDVQTPTRTSGWRWAAGAAVAVAVVAIAVAAFAIANDDDDNGTSSQALDSQRIAATQNACQQWLDDDSSSSGATPPQAWCNNMTGWMYDQMANGSMMGSMMWGNPQAMIDACRQWMTAPTGDTTATTGQTAWCDQMVGWMSQHMGNWGDWEDWDDHMDDGHWNGMMNR